MHPRNHACTIAATQDGLVTRRQALGAGMTRHHVESELAHGRWLEVQPQVYLVLGAPTSWRQRVRACTLTGPDGRDVDGGRGPAGADEPPRVVASHSTAAALLGLERVADQTRVEVSGVGLQRPVLTHVDVHRTRRLERCDVTLVDGIPVTSGARTLIDLAARMEPVALTALLDDAVCARVVARRWMHRRALSLANGRRGVGRLARLTGPEAEGEFRSWLERRAGFRAREHGLPPPLWNHPLRVGGRLLGVVDTFWPQAGLPVEWDGLRFHSSPAQQLADRQRDRSMTLAGYPPLRYSWLELEQDPAAVMEEIAAALRARGVSVSTADSR